VDLDYYQFHIAVRLEHNRIIEKIESANRRNHHQVELDELHLMAVVE
jgi:hypothetical protein